MAENALEELCRFKCVKYVYGKRLKPLKLGLEMARSFVQFDTIKNFFQSGPENSSLRLILDTISHSGEFQKFRSKMEQRRTLTKLNKGIRWPIKGAISTA